METPGPGDSQAETKRPSVAGIVRSPVPAGQGAGSAQHCESAIDGGRGRGPQAKRQFNPNVYA